MRRYWWFVWIKVAVLAAVLLIAYFTVRGIVSNAVKPYISEEPVRVATNEENTNILDKTMDWIDNKFDVHINYEDLIFDYANDYAEKMIEESEAERNLSETP